MQANRQRTLVLLVAIIQCGLASADPPVSVEEQRQAFRELYPVAERGEWTPVADREAQLAGYILWPDLRAAYLRTVVRTSDGDAEIRAFLEQYGELKPARDLRYRLAVRLAENGRHADYLDIYRRYYRDLGVAKLDCLALGADIALGNTKHIADRASTLWLVGKSQADECDPVFEYMRSKGALGRKMHLERYELAIDAKQFSLASYLGRSIDDDHVAAARAWQRAHDNPERFLSDSKQQSAGQLAYAVQRLAYRDPRKAADHWSRLHRSFRFDAKQDGDVSRHIALWAARLNVEGAGELLRKVPRGAVDDEVLRWRIRTALRQHAWRDVAAAIDELSADERARDDWQYWKAVALERLGHEAESMVILGTLALERSYYGFLAADQLNLDYAFAHSALERDDEVIARLESNPALVRARELFYVGLAGPGRSEWDAAVSKLDHDEKRQAAVLADSWGWHSRAIATAALTGHFDDLELRYPLPHRESFEAYSADARVQESWAYGIARSESLFMPDVRSVAGAIGVMQLMPDTGRSAAREISAPYAGRDTLIDPASNIRLGTFYLGKMFDRFDRHQALATAAYNAGPLRVEQWLPGAGAIDARIWIENIPFNETRAYVQRVLATDTIFHWRLTGETRRLSTQLPDIGSAKSPQVASY